MSYEYMTGMEKLPEGRIVERNTVSTPTPDMSLHQRIQGVPQGGPISEAEAQIEMLAHARTEVRDMTSVLQRLIERVRQGDQEAMSELQEAMNHHDIIETIQAFERYPDSHPNLSDSETDRRLWVEMRETFTLAQAVAEGRDPQRHQRAMLYIGGGGVVLATIVVAWLLLKKSR